MSASVLATRDIAMNKDVRYIFISELLSVFMASDMSPSQIFLQMPVLVFKGIHAEEIDQSKFLRNFQLWVRGTP